MRLVVAGLGLGFRVGMFGDWLFGLWIRFLSLDLDYGFIFVKFGEDETGV